MKPTDAQMAEAKSYMMVGSDRFERILTLIMLLDQRAEELKNAVDDYASLKRKYDILRKKEKGNED